MDKIQLCVMTRDLCHEFFSGFESDPAIYMDMSYFTPYEYKKEKVDQYYDAQQLPSRVVLAVMLQGKCIGEVKLKYIEEKNKVCTLGIQLQNDKVKGKGYGTCAQKLALLYAKNILGMKIVYADAVLKNVRSQHVLEKVGFQFLRKDEMFLYYQYEL